VDKLFEQMFSVKPDEIILGDYFYHIPWFDGLTAGLARKRRFLPENFKELWADRTFQNEFYRFIDSAWLEKIALENNPFMDIASSESMGLAAFILKMNPKIPCLVTDIDSYAMRNLRQCVNEGLPEYSISIASFDNLDIPIKDNSLDYITSIDGMSSCKKPAGGAKTYSFPYQASAGSEYVINEVYRVLKRGGRFVTCEQNTECDYDLQKIYCDFNEYGRLFGIYTYDEIQSMCRLLIEEPWRDKFISAGFQVEAEKKRYEKYSINEVKRFLYKFSYFNNIHDWTDEERVFYSLSQKQATDEMISDEFLVNILGNYKKIENGKPKSLTADEIKDILNRPAVSDRFRSDTEEIGIDIYGIETFFVLRK
jgi:Methylase involved in ubiquinone/menaquinone biosynthesis